MKLDDYWDRYYEIEREFDREDRGPHFEKLLDELKSEPEAQSDAIWLGLEGDLLYCLDRKKEALALFDAAIRLDTEDDWARMYVGHCLYEDGDIATAFKYFSEALEQKEARADLQALNCEEMVLCCRLQLDGLASTRAAIEEHLERCLAWEESPAYPINLDHVLEPLGYEIAESGLGSLQLQKIKVEK